MRRVDYLLPFNSRSPVHHRAFTWSSEFSWKNGQTGVAKHANLTAWNLKIAHNCDNTAMLLLFRLFFHHYSAVLPQAAYCDERVCRSVCQSVCWYVSATTVFKLNEVFCPLRYGKSRLPEAVASLAALQYIGWNDVIESMVTIRSPFCRYNLARYVELIGEDLPCYSDKI